MSPCGEAMGAGCSGAKVAQPHEVLSKEDKMSEDTYTGPKVDPEGKFFGSPTSPMNGGMFVVIGLAVLAVVLAIVGIVMANSADDHAGSVEKSVYKLGEAHNALAKKVKDDRDWAVAMLATKATATDVEAAIVILTAKADQSVVDKLSAELKDKASSRSVSDLASDLLMKADKKAVDRIARRVRKIDKRFDNLVGLNKLIEVAPAPPPPAPAPLPPAAKAPPSPAPAPPPPPAKAPPPAAK